VKRHRVIILPAAERDIGEAYEWIADADTEAAVKWYNQLLALFSRWIFFPNAPRLRRRANFSTAKSARFSTVAAGTNTGSSSP